MTEIYIDGIEFDVDDKVAKIAVTYQNFSFLNLSTVKANYTNRISLPLTTNNRLKLEQMAPLSAISTVPYVNHSIRIVQNGIEIIPSGVCQVTGVQDRIEIDVQSGIKGFFDALEGLYLNDIDLSAWNGLWDNDRHDTVRNATSGLVCPVVNTGQLVDGTTYVDGYTYGSAMIPFFYYSTIIDQIFTLVGYSKAGTIFSDTNRYSKMAMSTRLVYNEDWLLKSKCIAYAPGLSNYIQLSDPSFVYQKLGFTVISDGENGYFDVANNKYEVTSGAAIPFINVTVNASSYVIINSGGNFVRLAIYLNGVAVALSSATTNYLDISYTTDLQLGDVIELYVGIRANAGDTDIDLKDITLKITPNNTTDTDRIQSTTWHWYFEQLMPRVLLKDFIKDFMRTFGLVCTEKNNTVTFKTIEEILINASPTTTELIKENTTKRPDISYKLSGFGQNNNFYWIVQDDEELITDDFGKGIIIIDNETLQLSVDIYTSLFTASDQITEFGINQATQITIYDQAGPAFTKAASFGSRLILLRADDGVNFRFKSGTSRTDYFIGYFIDNNQSYSLDWQQLINTYYNTYEKVLNNFAEVTQEYLISQVQAVNMDLTVTKHKNGIRYLVEQVSSFVPGKFAKFKMYRILIGS